MQQFDDSFRPLLLQWQRDSEILPVLTVRLAYFAVRLKIKNGGSAIAGYFRDLDVPDPDRRSELVLAN